jgi:hypothetical protein
MDGKIVIYWLIFSALVFSLKRRFLWRLGNFLKPLLCYLCFNIVNYNFSSCLFIQQFKREEEHIYHHHKSVIFSFYVFDGNFVMWYCDYGKWSLDRISLDRISWSKVSNNLISWSNYSINWLKRTDGFWQLIEILKSLKYHY